MSDEVLMRAIEAGAFEDLRHAIEAEPLICSTDVRTLRAIVERLEGLVGRAAAVQDLLATLGYSDAAISESLLEALATAVLQDPYASPGAVVKRARALFEKWRKARLAAKRAACGL